MPTPLRTHLYSLSLEWTGNLGQGTSAYDSYSRNHLISSQGKGTLHLSSDPIFRGDPHHYSPEELLVASLSSCHMLWYLHLCADAGIIVTAYVDEPRGTMVEEPGGAGHFSEVVLRPTVTLGVPKHGEAADEQRATALHVGAHDRCFIARSMNFPVRCEPRILSAGTVRPAGTEFVPPTAGPAA